MHFLDQTCECVNSPLTNLCNMTTSSHILLSYSFLDTINFMLIPTIKGINNFVMETKPIQMWLFLCQYKYFIVCTSFTPSIEKLKEEKQNYKKVVLPIVIKTNQLN